MAFSDDAERTSVAYCPSCSVSLTRTVHPDVAHVLAQQHAQITGHVVNVVIADTWTVVDTVAGEPSLPLWD